MGGNTGLRVTARWGGGGGGGGAIVGLGGQRGGGGGVSTSKNRPSHHKYKSPKQFELKKSWKALRELNARWALPDYPASEDKKPVKRKIA